MEVLLMKRVAINGLGRIGRLVLRRYMEVSPSDIEIVALNKPSPPRKWHTSSSTTPSTAKLVSVWKPEKTASFSTGKKYPLR